MMAPENKTNDQLFAIMMRSSAFSCGVLGAALGPVERVFEHPTLVLKPLTFLGAVAGWFLGWGIWAFVRGRIAKENAALGRNF